MKVLVCCRCKGLWMRCPCVYGHALFFPLHSLNRGWLVKSQELGPA